MGWGQESPTVQLKRKAMLVGQLERERNAALAEVERLRMSRAGETTVTVYDEIRQERARAHVKHGATSMESAPADDPTGRRFRILSEEVGEVAREFNDAEHDERPVDLAKVRKELIQTAAMAAAWADAIAVEVTHACPPRSDGLTPCCGKTPFELPRADRLTVDVALVTCRGA